MLCGTVMSEATKSSVASTPQTPKRRMEGRARGGPPDTFALADTWGKFQATWRGSAGNRGRGSRMEEK